MGKCNAHQLEKWNFCSRFQTFCAGEHCRFFEEEKPMTNADHIRSMSDEELAKWLDAIVVNCHKDCCEGCQLEAACYGNGVLALLKQPYKEN